MPAGGGVPLEDIGVGDARTLRAEAAAAEAEGRFGYGADVGTGAPRKGAPEFVDVRKYAAGSDGDGDGEDGDAAGAYRSDDHDDWDLSSLGTTSPGLWRLTLETADEALALPRPTARLLRRADVDGPDGDGRTLASFAPATGAELVTVTDGTWRGLLRNVRQATPRQGAGAVVDRGIRRGRPPRTSGSQGRGGVR